LEWIPYCENTLGGVLMLGNVELTIGEALGVSLTGVTVVFLALISLLIAIIIISKIVGGIEGTVSKGAAPQKSTQPSAPAAKKAVDNSMDPALLAAIVGAISMQERSRVESFRIVSITEQK